MLNFATIKNKVSQLVGEHYLNENHDQAEAIYRDYMKTVKESPILRLEYVVFKNLEQNGLNEKIVHSYIDKNLSLFSKFNKREIINEHKKLEPFLLKNINLKNDNHLLNESIQNLILENSKSNKIPDINKLHESLCVVLENLIKPVERVNNSINENTTKYGFKTFAAAARKVLGDSYKELNEAEKTVLAMLMEKNIDKRDEMFANLKAEGIAWAEQNSEDSQELTEVVTAINEMIYSDDNALKLYEMLSD